MSLPSLEERRPAITPQLAVRVAMLGGFALVLFAALFFRLWFLQVLSGEEYVSQAAQNRVRKIKIEAPRGDIVDREGRKLVTTRQAAVVQMIPTELPQSERDLAADYGKAVSAAERERLAAADRLRDLNRARRRSKKPMTQQQRRERSRLAKAAARARAVPVPPMPADPELRRRYSRLGRVIDVSPRQIHRRVIQQMSQTPYAAITIKTDVDRAAYNYLRERQARFPGVKPVIQYLRSYPKKEVGAHLFGTLREISPEELKLKRYRGLAQGDRIGKDGVEETYDKYLRGTDGYYRQVVDALNRPCDDPVRCPERVFKPQQGQQLRLTLDLGLQRAGQRAVARAVAAAAGNGAQAGAFVAMDPRNGEVLALGSVPSFDANLFAKPISQEKYDQLNSEASGKPLLNRAIDGVYPSASTFKVITAAAALEEGLITPQTTYNDNGVFRLGPQEFTNARRAVNGTIALSQALKVSSDVFFYWLGSRMYPLEGQVLQTWAARFGLGRQTGIDLPGEFSGLVPDREWRDGGFRAYERCRKKRKLPYQSQAALFACGGIDRPYSAGDNVNLSVGQGDLQVTPLQMAVAYSAIANGGTVVTPHLGWRVEDGHGRLLQRLKVPPQRKLKISGATRNVIMEGIARAASEPGGTSYDVFSDFPHKVYGKTGTAERGNDPDQSWYVAIVNDDPSKPIVVAVTIERGGWGAQTAAPAARLILNQWFGLRDDEFRAGSSHTR
ncbi:MAG TPA: penicillin-binding protein 2 [Solirubrobacteraceae bacterium]|nr:penicillin-binding protein 2 [Solirubrobacteraceae bacterium]